MVVQQQLARVVSLALTLVLGSGVSGHEGPPGSESGLVSNFDSGDMTVEFGAGWADSTDAIQGGDSSVRAEVIAPGAGGSAGALRVTGQLNTGIEHPWAGVMFSPGPDPYAPANLSSKRGISFFARGDGGTYVVMLFLQSRGFTPVGQTFEVGSKWARYTFPFEKFDGTDGRDLTGVFIGASGRAGPYAIEIDEVQFEAGGQEVAAPPRIDNLRHPPDYETVPRKALGRIEIIGHGPTPLIMIPGLAHGGEIFRPFAEHNRDRYLMVLLTPPGVGGTPAPPMPDPPDTGYGERPWCRDYEHAIWEVIERLHLESPILVGYSDGLQHAIRVALDHPESVAGVISVIGEPLRTLPWPASEGTRVELVEKRMAHAWFRSVTSDVWRSGMGSGSWYSADSATGRQLYEASLVPTIPTMVRYFCERWSYDPIPELEELPIPILALLPDAHQLAEDANYQSFLTIALIGPWESIPATSLLDTRVLPGARLGALVDLVEPVSALVAEFVTMIQNRNDAVSRIRGATQFHDSDITSNKPQEFQ